LGTRLEHGRGHGWRTTETDFIQAGIQRIRGWRREAGEGGGLRRVI
jgi:hypothetical protein